MRVRLTLYGCALLLFTHTAPAALTAQQKHARKSRRDGSQSSPSNSSITTHSLLYTDSSTTPAITTAIPSPPTSATMSDSLTASETASETASMSSISDTLYRNPASSVTISDTSTSADTTSMSSISSTLHSNSATPTTISVTASMVSISSALVKASTTSFHDVYTTTGITSDDVDDTPLPPPTATPSDKSITTASPSVSTLATPSDKGTTTASPSVSTPATPSDKSTTTTSTTVSTPATESDKSTTNPSGNSTTTASTSVSTPATPSDKSTTTASPSVSTPTNPSGNSTITASPSTSTSSLRNDTTAVECSDPITLLDMPVEFVTQTTVEEFTVTVTALNQTLTTPPIEYPPPPCVTVLSTSFASSASYSMASEAGTEPATPMPTSTVAPFTSTIVATRKIPVPYLPTSNGPQFVNPSDPPPNINPSPTPPPDFQEHPNPTPENGVQHNADPQPTNGNSQNNEPPHRIDGPDDDNPNSQNKIDNSNNADGGSGSQTPGIGAIIASIINQPWLPRPAPTTLSDNANPSTPAPPLPGNGQGTPIPVNPGAIISNIQKFTSTLAPEPAPAPTPTEKVDQNIPILVAPSDVVIGNQVVHIPSGTHKPNIAVVNGQSFTVAATEVIGPYMTLPLPANSGTPGTSPGPVVVGGVPVLVETSQAIISGHAYSIGPTANPTTIVVDGQTISIGPAGVGFASTTIRGSYFTNTAIGGAPVAVGISQAVVSDTTYDIGPSASPTTITVNGQTISIGSGGVGFPSTTVQGSALVSTAVGGVSFGLGASQVVVSGTTYETGPTATPTTIVVNGQTISIGSGGVGIASTTLRRSDFSTTAVGAVTVGMGSTQAVISGTTYNIGPSATPTTIVVNGQAISIGPSGVEIASTPLRLSGFSTTTVNGVTIGIGSSEVIVSGTTYNIGPSATPTTIVVNGESISIGPSGLGFTSTTIPASRATGATGPSTAPGTLPNTLPSRTGGQSSIPSSPSGASASTETILSALTALLIVAVVGFNLL